MAEQRSTISKRTFLAALPCSSAGWYAWRAADDDISPGLRWLFWCGSELGAAARGQLGSGLMLPFAPLELATETTQRMIAESANTLLFEATFRYGALVARADAIRRIPDGWDIVEVKSGKEPKEGKSFEPGYLDDLAYTVMVARNAGLPVRRCTLMLVSRQYRRGSAGELLVEFDLTTQVFERADELHARADGIREALMGDVMPDPSLALLCRKCDYFATECLGRDVAASIFVLPGLSDKRLDRMKPIVDLHQLPADVDLTDNQRRVFDVIRSGTPQVMPGLKDLDKVTWPAFYLDFETVTSVLPWFDGDPAGEQHLFQYSIHRCDGPGSPPSHHEYLAPFEGDWRRELAERLLNDLGDQGSVIVYTSFEQQRLEELAERFPELALRINAVIARLFDLHAVVKNGYCHPAFQGRTSIKYVLPALVPDLSYKEMAIPEGQSASGVFGLMRVGALDTATFAEWRRHLLAYCCLDTLAMVKVHEVLVRVRSGAA